MGKAPESGKCYVFIQSFRSTKGPMAYGFFLLGKGTHGISIAGGPNGSLTPRGKPQGQRPLGKESSPGISSGSNWHGGWEKKGPCLNLSQVQIYSLLMIKAMVGQSLRYVGVESN